MRKSTIIITLFTLLFRATVFATIWSVAAPAELSSIYTGSGYLNGDTILLTTNGGSYTWATNLNITSKSVIIKSAPYLDIRPEVALTSSTAGVAFTCTTITAPIDFYFDGIVVNGNGKSTGFVIPKNSSTYNVSVTMNNCKFYNFASSVALIGYSAATGTTTYGNLIVKNSSFFNFGRVYHITSSTSCQPANVLFENCLFSGITSTGATYGAIITPATVYPGTSLTVNHCTFNGTADHEIYVKSGAVATTLIKNSIFANTQLPTTGTNNVFGTGNVGNLKNGVYYAGIASGNLVKYPWINGAATGQAFLITDPVLDATSYFATSLDYIGAGTDGNNIGYYNAAPKISTFTPSTAANGTTVTITGSNFTGTTYVAFGGVSATSFTVNSDTEITALVANGVSGNIVVNNGNGVGSISGFVFDNTTTSINGQTDISEIGVVYSKSGQLSILTDKITSGQLMIFNMAGQRLFTKSINSSVTELNCNLSLGVYIVKTFSEGRIKIKKFVVE